MRNGLLLVALLPLAALAQTPGAAASAPAPGYRFAVGVLGSYQTVGAQAEWRANARLAVKAIGARQFGQERRAEHAGAGIGLLTYYFPSRYQFLEPLVGLGGIYSWYHWDLLGTRGTIRDVNVGAAFGTNLRFGPRFRSGLNVFVGNGFRADYAYAERRMTVVGRRLLVMPTLTLDFLL